MNSTKIIGMLKNFLTFCMTLLFCWLVINYYLYHITALDGRGIVHALQDEWRITPDIVSNLSPQSYAKKRVHPAYKSALPQNIQFPIGGVPNARVIYCEEDEGWHIEKSDRYGFFNPDNAWDRPINTALVGDSFAQGACTNQHIRYWYDKLGDKNIVSMGMGGNGTLIEYASFSELLNSQHKPQKVFWLIVSNDITDITAELQTPILNEYLINDSFTQNYFELDLEQYTENALAAVPDYIKRYEGEIELLRQNPKSPFISILKGEYIELRIKKYKEFQAWKNRLLEQAPVDSESEIKLAEQKRTNLNKMNSIFHRANEDAKREGVQLTFVFIPSSNHCYLNIYPQQFVQIERFFEQNSISHFRGHQILAGESCTNLFATKKGGHLNAYGYKRIAERLLVH